MTYQALVNILTGKQRGKKTTRRFGGDTGLVKSSFNIGRTKLAVTSDEDSDRDWVSVNSEQHFTYKESVETKVRIVKLPHHPQPHAVIRLSASEKMQSILVGHENQITVNEASTTFVSVDDLVALRDEISKEIRKAKRQDLI